MQKRSQFPGSLIRTPETDRQKNPDRDEEELALAEKKKKQTLEEMFGQLETIIGELEADDVSLEKSFDLYNKGMNLLKECGKSIDEVEKKVLVLDEDGSTHEF